MQEIEPDFKPESSWNMWRIQQTYTHNCLKSTVFLRGRAVSKHGCFGVECWTYGNTRKLNGNTILWIYQKPAEYHSLSFVRDVIRPWFRLILNWTPFLWFSSSLGFFITSFLILAASYSLSNKHECRFKHKLSISSSPVLISRPFRPLKSN